MKIALIDDSASDRCVIASFLNTFFSEAYSNIPLFIEQYESGEDFLSTFSRNSFDIIFIDYYMKTLSGLETANRIRQVDMSVSLIFVSVSKDYALDGYLVKASGYLLKPITYEMLAKTLRLLDLEKLKKHQYIEFINGNEYVQILINDIIYCEIFGHYSHIYTQNRGVQRVRTAFSTLTEKLSPYPEFLQCFRGCLVNMAQIIRIENGAFVMTNNARIPFRRTGQNAPLKVYSAFLFEKMRNGE